jgi:hypothetical protein
MGNDKSNVSKMEQVDTMPSITNGSVDVVSP